VEQRGNQQGRIEEAIAAYRRALEIRPGDQWAHSNMLIAMNSRPPSEHGGGLLAEHVEWARRHAAGLYPAGTARFGNDSSQGRRLRVGYVSPDFRRHSVAYFVQPILAGHDHQQFEVFCYASVRRPDEVTAALKSQADQWRDIAAMSDEQAAEMIRADRIDILVDLAGHTANHRLTLFARRAAPVQVTYLGYPNTTGLATMDYRLTDAAADPPGTTESHYTERLVRLPHGFLCYMPPGHAPEPRAMSAANGSPITFASFNNLAKVTQAMVGLWAKILRRVPDSILLLKAGALADQATQARVRAEFDRHGIGADRIELRGREPSPARHLAMYHRVDVALDTSPYNGTTTTCEALWMGVPVVTLAGQSHASRVGASLLTCADLAMLIARGEEEYVAIVSQLAHDLERRLALAATLRQKMQGTICTARRFLADLEAAYVWMWEQAAKR
jgi:predicted O-linked N-acetylglucosamine transferase (SPINDLY family)